MLKLLRIVDKVEKPVMISEAVSLNISANGDCPDDITSILGKLVNLSNPQPVSDKMMPQGDNHDVMMKTISNVGDYADQVGHDYAEEMGEEYANEPKPTISDVASITVKAGGGMNGPKKQYRKEYPGDNPMAVAESRAAELMLEYKKMLEGGNPVNKAKKNAAVSAVGAANKDEKHLTTKGTGVRNSVANKIRGREKMSGKDRMEEDRMDELSPKTMGSYINKAVPDLAVNARMAAGKPGSSEENKTAIKRATGIKRAADKLSREATDPRDSRPETHRTNNTGYAWDKLSTRSTSSPKDSKATKSGKQLGLKHSIKGALGSHGPKGHLPEATDKKPTDDAKKKKSEKMKSYRADRDKHGED